MLGECKGECDVGKRTDTRTCKRAVCQDALTRTVNCRLPNSCVANQACEALGQFCHGNATCVKYSTETAHQCECGEGYQGNGTHCSISAGSGLKGLKVLLLAALFSCLQFV